MVTVASWAHRVLRPLSRYSSCRDKPDVCGLHARRVEAAWTDVASEPPLLLGVYLNPAGVEPEAIVISETAMFWRTAASLNVAPFGDLKAVRGPTNKEDAEIIDLLFADGRVSHLRVAGGEGKYRDVYPMVRFLLRVLELKESGTTRMK